MKHPALTAGGPWMQLASGAPFALKGPSTLLSIRDVAASLSKIPRFGGATRTPYSVAQHSVLVYRLVSKRTNCLDTKMWALLHDAHEMVVGDIPHPAKVLLEPVISLLLADLDNRIKEGLGLRLSGVMTGMIAHADMMALAAEKRDLLVHGKHPWCELPNPAAVPPIVPFPSYFQAYAEFLGVYETLADEMADKQAGERVSW